MKPKIFVSSTVLDFEDLRSALKYYLEDFGYEVQMSEYPNFEVDLDSSTFDACTANIAKCNYFILLIGYRRGSWYENDKLSITHKEYQTAKELIENGNPLRIITFIRKPLWVLKSEHEAFLKFLSDKGKELVEDSNNVNSSIIDDPAYVFNFISEVNKGIVFPGSTSPANNWIFDFSNFEDIITALRHTFNINLSLEEKRIKKALISELELNYNRFLIPDYKRDRVKNDEPIPTMSIIDYFKENFESRHITSDKKILFVDAPVVITSKEFSFLYFYAVLVPIQIRLKDLNTRVLEKVITEGIYLHFDIEKGDYKISLLSIALDNLLDWINIFKGIFNTSVYKEFTDELNKIAFSEIAKQENIVLPLKVSGGIMGLINNWRIPHLINAILSAIRDDDFKPLIDFNFNS